MAPLLDGVDVHTFDRPDPEAVAALRARYGIRRSAWWWATGLLAEYRGWAT